MSLLKNLSMTSGVFFVVVFALSLVSAQNDLELSSLTGLESVEEIEELLRDVQFMLQKNVHVAGDFPDGTVQEDVSDDREDGVTNVAVDEDDAENDVAGSSNGCSCSRYGCSCCKRIRFRVGWKIFHKMCCLRVAYLRRHIGILITLTVDGRTLFRKEISARNPPPICSRLPYVGRSVTICIQFNNLSVRGRRISGCSSVLIRLFRFTILKVKLGCFRFNTQNVTQQIGEVEFPFLDEPRDTAEGPEPIYLEENEMDDIKPNYYKNN